MGSEHQDNGQRAAVLPGVRRVVVKVGTRLLTGVRDVSKGDRVRALVGEIHALRQRGFEVILVSSGAIGAGMTILGTPKRPRSIPQLQAHAAVGQCRLMYLYETACGEHGFHCAQLLLTAEDVRDRARQLNICNCLHELLASHVLPVINENDSVSVEEIRFGDNDTLAALVGTLARADLTILLTTIDGLHEVAGDGAFGARLSVVHGITPRIRAMAGGTDGNEFSVGGMATKLRAAETVTRAGEPLLIADGRDFAILRDVFAGADVGTLFLPAGTQRMSAGKRYLAFFSRPAGDVWIDAGAERALCEAGRSLLPSGVRDLRGAFRAGDVVRVLGPAGTEVARGVSNYSRDELARIKGLKTAQLAATLGHDAYDEVIHRDRLVVTRATAD
jgi:glutamate 5-kinase